MSALARARAANDCLHKTAKTTSSDHPIGFSNILNQRRAPSKKQADQSDKEPEMRTEQECRGLLQELQRSMHSIQLPAISHKIHRKGDVIKNIELRNVEITYLINSVQPVMQGVPLDIQ